MSTSTTMTTDQFIEHIAWLGQEYEHAYDQRALWSVGGMYGLEPRAEADIEQLETAIRNLVIARTALILQGDHPDEATRRFLKHAQDLVAAISSMMKVTWTHSPLGDPWRHDEVVYLANLDAYYLSQSIKKAALHPPVIHTDN